VTGSGGRKRNGAHPRERGRAALLAAKESLEPSVDAAQAAASLLGRKWVLPVLGALAAQPLRRFQLAVQVPGISPKVLTETLRLLEREGLVGRVLVREAEEVTVGIAYELTPLGRSLDRPVTALARWYALHDEARAAPVSDRDRLGA
jgi:DNA-binding HxlR family transcriptional regulator